MIIISAKIFNSNEKNVLDIILKAMKVIVTGKNETLRGKNES